MPIHIVTLLAVLVSAVLSARSLAVSAKTNKTMSLISPLIAAIAVQATDIQSRVPLISTGTDNPDDVAKLQAVSATLAQVQNILPAAPVAGASPVSDAQVTDVPPAAETPLTNPQIEDPAGSQGVGG